MPAGSPLERVVRMIGEQRATSEILGALRLHIAAPEPERQVVFFLIEGRKWTLAAAADMPDTARDKLALISPERLSEALFGTAPQDDGREERPFDFGWARHLISGTGEMLGIVLGIEDGPVVPVASYAAAIESVCSLAALAIEHRNLVAEVSFRSGRDPFPAFLEQARDAEASTQHAARMIARQAPLEETLGSLCWELHAAVILVENDEWTVAARGIVTVSAEAALARLDPAALSAAMLAGADPGATVPFDGGWARHLYSATGELLGLMVGIEDGPFLPCGAHALRIESVSAMAVLAIEQRNLRRDLPAARDQIRFSTERIAALQDLSLLLEDPGDSRRHLENAQSEAQSLLAILDVLESAPSESVNSRR